MAGQDEEAEAEHIFSEPAAPYRRRLLFASYQLNFICIDTSFPNLAS
jgi:hypothetical protein